MIIGIGLPKKMSHFQRLFVARTRLFAMISFAFDLPKAFAPALRLTDFFICPLLGASSASLPNKKASQLSLQSFVARTRFEPQGESLMNTAFQRVIFYRLPKK